MSLDVIRFRGQHLDRKTGGYREATVELTLDQHRLASVTIEPIEGTLQDAPEPEDDAPKAEELEKPKAMDDAPPSRRPGRQTPR
jgi:hypothetical protein